MSHTEGTDSCAVCAWTDIALELVDGLSQIRDLTLTKSIVMRIARQLPVSAVMERISNSRFATELVRFLPHVYGDKSIDLRPAAVFISESGDDLFDEETRVAFAELYCGMAIRECLLAQDFQHAWRTILYAFPGWTSLSFDEGGWIDTIKHPHEITGLRVSMSASERYLQELYAAMRDENLVPNVADPLKAIAIATYFAVRKTAGQLAVPESA